VGAIERLGAAWAALRGDDAPVRRMESKNASIFAFPEWMRTRARWNIDDKYPAYVDEAYRLNSLVYAPIRYKARSLASVPLVAATGEQDNPEWLPDNHPLARLVARPNRNQTWRAFTEQRKTYLELAGNAYVYAERDKKGTPTALHNLRPDRVRILPTANGIQGFYYILPGQAAGDGVPMLVEDVVHTKYPNPLDDLEGMGYGIPPILSAARDIDTDNSVTAFIKLLFDRGAMPMGMLRYDVPLTEEDADLAKRRFMDRYGSYERWIEPLVVDQGGGYERIGMTFDELGFDVLDARNEARILSVFGVPPILLGTRYGIAHGTYSNYEQARTQFWQDVLVAELRMFEDDDQRLLNSADTFVMYDLSVVPALQADTPALVQAARTLWEMGVPANKAFVAVGLAIENIEGGDTAYVPTGMTVVGAPSEPVSVTSGTDNTEDDRPAPSAGDLPKARALGEKERVAKGWSIETKAQHWKALDDIALAHEDGFRAMAVAQFERDRRAVMVIVGQAEEKTRVRKATIEWEPVLPDILKVLETHGESWREAFIPLVRGVVKDTSEYWATAAGLAFDVRRLEDQAFFIDYAMDFWSQVGQTTRDEVGGIVQRGIRDGWSIPDMQKSLRETFEQWIVGSGDPDVLRFASDRVTPYRTEMIARTESTKATAWGAQQVYRDAGVKRKEWLATKDDRTRPSHVTANGQVRDIDDAFEVGGYKMMQPGDSTQGAPTDEIVMCRCTVLPIIPKERE